MKRYLPFIFCLLVLNACKKDKDKEPETSEPEVTTGNLRGKVNHYDQYGTLYTSGLNTTTVSIEDKEFSAVTDTAGLYTLTGVPSGTYTLVFKKQGCGLIKKEIIYKFQDTVTYNAGVADIPAFSLSSAYAKDTSWFSQPLPGIYYNAIAAPANSKSTVVAIIGKTPALDLANPLSYLNYATASVLQGTSFDRFFSYSLLKDTYTFRQDSILYLKIYPVANTAASYFSNKLNTLVFTAYGTPYPTVFTLTVK